MCNVGIIENTSVCTGALHNFFVYFKTFLYVTCIDRPWGDRGDSIHVNLFTNAESWKNSERE